MKKAVSSNKQSYKRDSKDMSGSDSDCSTESRRRRNVANNNANNVGKLEVIPDAIDDEDDLEKTLDKWLIQQKRGVTRY